MKCPYCSAEMEKGYIDRTDFRFQLEWYPAQPRTSILVSNNRNIKLTSPTNSHIVAYHCINCKKLIIDYT